jgi:4-hydroxy-tetrahydrodipicolinate synthase
MEPQTVAELAKLPNIVGIKEAKGDIRQLSKIVQLCSEEFCVLSGDDFTLLPSLSVGAKGIISASANVCAKDMVLLIDAYRRGDVEEAKRLHQRIFPVCEAMFCETNPAPAKEALFQMELIKTPYVRPPLVGLLPKNKERVRCALKEYGALKEGG